MILFRLEIHRLAIKAILANKVRSFLTMLGVIIGVSSVILLVSIGSGLKEYISGQFRDLGTNILFVVPGSKGFQGDPGSAFANNKLSEKEYDNLKRELSQNVKVALVFEATKRAKFASFSELIDINGIAENYFDVAGYKINEGQKLSQNDIVTSARRGIIGPTIVSDFFPNGSPIGKTIILGNEKILIIGVYASKGGGFGGVDRDKQIFVPYTTAKKYFGLEKASAFFIQLTDGFDKEASKRQIKTILLKTLKEDQFSIVSQDELLNSITGILNALTIGLGGIAAISLLVGGIGIMNIMLVSVTERTREIGLRKAVGAKPLDILSQFLIEAVALSTFGGTIGILLGFLGSLGLKSFINTAITPWSVIIAFVFSAFVGIAFGTWPAYKASKKDPIEALRYE